MAEVEVKKISIHPWVAAEEREHLESFAWGCLELAEKLHTMQPRAVIVPCMGGFVPIRVAREMARRYGYENFPKDEQIFYVPASHSVFGDQRERITYELSKKIFETVPSGKIVVVDEAQTGHSIAVAAKQILRAAAEVGKGHEVSFLALKEPSEKLHQDYRELVYRGLLEEISVKKVVSMDSPILRPVVFSFKSGEKVNPAMIKLVLKKRAEVKPYSNLVRLLLHLLEQPAARA